MIIELHFYRENFGCTVYTSIRCLNSHVTIKYERSKKFEKRMLLSKFDPEDRNVVITEMMGRHDHPATLE